MMLFKAAAIGLLLAGPAAADGVYASFDAAARNDMAVLSVDRGRTTYALAAGRDRDGFDARGNPGDRWVKAAVMQSVDWQGIRLRYGGSFYASDSKGASAGLRLNLDSYRDEGGWGRYWMIELDSATRSGLALVSARHADTGLGLEMSVYKERHDPPAPQVMASWTVPGRDVSVRAGWRFKDDEFFVGISFSRFR